MNITDFPNGMTVAELKSLIADWPDKNEDGEDNEVWLETGRNASSPCVSVWPLNLRKNRNGSEYADFLLAPSTEAWKE